jgi:spermidine synthase
VSEPKAASSRRTPKSPLRDDEDWDLDPATRSPGLPADATASHTAPGALRSGHTALLFLNVFIIATCGLVYELVAGTLASYLLGDSVMQFSLCIGIYLSALGAGAWLSGYVDRALARCFIEVELGVALLGGLSAPLLFVAFPRIEWFHALLYGLVFAIGTLVGLELPLLMRILREQLDFKQLVARVLTFDYIGALVGSLLFPILFVPRLGLVRTSLLFGVLNALVGLWGTWLLRPLLVRSPLGLRVRAVVLIALLVGLFVAAERISDFAEQKIYADPIVYAEQSEYQRIVMTQSASRFQLFLNGKLQFHSGDEYRYHEALVHPAMAVTPHARTALVLGGGDGLALRELLKYDRLRRVTLVDLDPAMTDLSKRFPPLADLNGEAFDDPRVEVVNQDAMIWLQTARGPFDVVIIDFPDPNSFALGKLYTRQFYRMLRSRLAEDGTVALQATSPLFARKAFWCIQHTLSASGFAVQPYHVAVPSFGIWGFGLARREPFAAPHALPPGIECRFLNDQTMPAMFALPEDLGPVETEINRLDNQALVRYYERY